MLCNNTYVKRKSASFQQQVSRYFNKQENKFMLSECELEKITYSGNCIRQKATGLNMSVSDQYTV